MAVKYCVGTNQNILNDSQIIQVENFLFTWSTGDECIVSECDQTADVCFTMYVYFTKLKKRLQLVLYIQLDVKFYLYISIE